MKIKNLKVSNFRNLKNIDIDFKNINILTGKNSSGKTNITQLLVHCLSVDNEIEKIFGKNILTYSKGVRQTNIETIISDFNFSYGVKSDNGNISFYKPEVFTYKLKIGKNPIGIRERSLDFFGKTFLIDNLSKNKNINYGFDKLETSKSIKINNAFIDSNINQIDSNIIPKEGGQHFFNMFKKVSQNKIAHFDDGTSFSNASGNIFEFVTGIKDIDKKEVSLQAIEEINKKEKDNKQGLSNFSSARFIFLIADIQRDIEKQKNFYDDLSDFTDGILNKVYINMDGQEGSKGDIYVDSPNGPKNIELISAGTAIILYFVMLKNWLSLKNKSYQKPDIMIFDELDCAIHPSLIGRFSDLLKLISNNVQLFITSHSSTFIDNFNKENMFLLRDLGSFNENAIVETNIMSYESILNTLDQKAMEEFKYVSNSDLYVNGYIDSLFPVTFKKGVKK